MKKLYTYLNVTIFFGKNHFRVAKIDLNVWYVSFGGIFLLKGGFGFFVQATEILFLALCFLLLKFTHLGNFG